MYLEDVDVILRANVMGWQNYFVSGAIAKHMGSASSTGSGFSLKMTFRNNFPMLVKNMQLKILLRLAPRLVKSDINTMRHLWRQKEYALSLKIPSGRVAGTLMLPKMIAKRRKLEKYRKNSNSDYIWQLMKRVYIK
jgi:GT2 family glycosyltransferase